MINDRNDRYDHPLWQRRVGIRPFNARSLVLSVLLGLDPPVLPVRALVDLGRAVRHRPGHDAHGAVADGRRRRAVGRRRRLPARRPAARAQGGPGHRASAGARPWDGDVVGRRRHRAAARRRRAAGVPHAHGQPADGRAAPGHVDAPGQPRRPDRRRRAGRRARAADGDDPADLVARLWPLRRRSRRRPASSTGGSTRCCRRSPTAAPTRCRAAITLAAEVVRFLRAEPLLPPSLTPQPWPPDELRDRYRAFDRPSVGARESLAADHPST